MDIRLKRAYEPAQRSDGCRVLVDRLWPRGVSKTEARVKLWLKDIAPSAELRKWFGHEPGRWAEFARRYRAELKHNDEAIRQLRELAEHGPVTLVYAARDEAHNQAVVLKHYLETVA